MRIQIVDRIDNILVGIKMRGARSDRREPHKTGAPNLRTGSGNLEFTERPGYSTTGTATQHVQVPRNEIDVSDTRISCQQRECISCQRPSGGLARI